jgi:tripartite-type tricarboxylate transporter receptor subunit TctC
MRFGFRALAALVLAVAIAPAAPAQAQKYPSAPLKFVVPVPPGGGVDFLARAIAQKMSENIGVPVIIDNKPGASAVIGTEFLAKSPPDGYTLMMAYSAHVTNPLFNKDVPYDVINDFSAVVHVGFIPLILVTPPTFAPNSVKELIALAKAKPGQLNYASGGAGAGAHLSGELFKYLANVDLVHVPYKGNAPALTDVLGGHVQIMFDTITTSLPHVQKGTLKALGVTSTTRSSLAPDVPTMIEAGLPDFEVSAWYVVLVPAKTPKPIVQTLNTEINKVLNDADVRARFLTQGVEIVGGTPEQADTFLRAEAERWKKVVAATGIKAQ